MRQMNHIRGFCWGEGLYKPVSPCLKSSESLATQHTEEQMCMCALECLRGGYINRQTCQFKQTNAHTI